MDKSQYHPPYTEYSAELYEQIEKSAVQSTPERNQPAPFHFVKEMEALVDSFRDTAEAIEQKDGREVKVRFIPVSFSLAPRSHSKIREALMEQEKLVGRNLFADKERYYFWKGQKGTSIHGTSEVDDWYLEETAPGMPSGTGVLTHIETHPNDIRKFNHQGQPVPLTLSDLEVFVPLTYHYVRGILEMPEYQFDKERAEVILDDMDVPSREDILSLLPPTSFWPIL